MAKHKLMIGTPAVRNPTWRYMQSVMGLDIPFPWLWAHQPGYGGVDAALNALLVRFLNTGADWFVIMADDAIVHPQSIARLVSWEKPCVAALAFLRYAPILPAVYLRQNEKGLWASEVELVTQWIRENPGLMTINQAALLDPRPANALLPVGRFGTHVTLLHREVIEAIEPPWFERQDEDGSGEDFAFVAKVEAAGFQPYIDLSQCAGHAWGDWSIGALDYMAWAANVDWNTGEMRIEVDNGKK